MMKPSLFIGITCWNSELFIGKCIESIKKCTRNVTHDICVIDNKSTDSSVRIARSLEIPVIQKRCLQSEALNILLGMSNAEYTLLIHSDVVLLNKSWFDICIAKLIDMTILISPEDIGCGPLTRPFGKDKPESSFMLFKTSKIKKCRSLHLKRRKWRVSLQNNLDFSGGHLTHKLPEILSHKTYTWFPMDVYISPREELPLYVPSTPPPIWSEELPYLRYGLGNFYGVDDNITHYHNWYDRVVNVVEGNKSSPPRGSEFPRDFILQYTNRFLKDYDSNQIIFPTENSRNREPKAL